MGALPWCPWCWPPRWCDEPPFRRVARSPHSRGPNRRCLAPHPRWPAVDQSAAQAPTPGAGGGQWPGRGLGGGHPGGAGLPGEAGHLPRQPPPGPFGGSPRRHQRRQELRQRWRQHRAALCRHAQGRRLPGPGGRLPPPRRNQWRHHRPVRGPGRALRPGVRRHPGQPQLWRLPGEPHLLRPRSNRPAAALWRLPGPDAPGGRRPGGAPHPPGHARAGHGGWGGPGHRLPPLAHRCPRNPYGPCGAAGERRLFERLLPLHQRPQIQCQCDLGGPSPGGVVCQSLLYPDPSHLHPQWRRLPKQAHLDEREPAQRRPGVVAG